MSDVRPVRRALVAVYDKAGVVELARGLAELGVEIVSSGGTASTLRDAEIEVTPVEEVTGFPEMLEGRVKTLHPKIHAGILADRRKAEHEAQLAERGIDPFDLVVINLYPFRETVASGATQDEVIEKIDIGGPAMMRAAAKNFASVGVVVSPDRYAQVLRALRSDGGLTLKTRRALAAEAFAHSAAYDAAVASWFGSDGERLPSFVGLAFDKVAELRYGENPHQRGALYAESAGRGVLGGAEILIEGKEMSFNNWLDVDAALTLAADLEPLGPSAVVVKHNTPCGAAVERSLADAYAAAFESDSVSAFGGIVAFGSEADVEAARAMGDVFTEVVVAPSFSEGALSVFGERKGLRVVRAPLPAREGLDVRTLTGGALIQDGDAAPESGSVDLDVVSARTPTDDEWRDLRFAWIVAMRVKSNAIVFARELATVGIGAGQMSRVDASFLAARKAGDRAKGSVMASDAFFPFPDAVGVAADAGVTAVIHPGGSIRDDEVLAAAEARGMAVVVTGRRHFRH
ncbi:MAG TPA: bifunctional phosphoribosylaminoimidazolecarboxamide formyltransferase/IMP cyclohydrolase [Actinomycetota bacterium]|nr:bifunctional phosphoribosylaminoimidazolecarboxamide formyltransferase/IMP cyclohydrolase [Actinomycetota bacterium]